MARVPAEFSLQGSAGAQEKVGALRLIGNLLVMALLAFPLGAKSFLSQEQALALAFPAGSEVERESLFLSPAELERAQKLSGTSFDDELVARYVGRRDGAITGYAYFDAHRVRTLPEAIMIVVDPSGEIASIEILSFNEPQEYLPRTRWIDQLDGQKLDTELSLNKAIRPITGATLSGRAIVNASRKMLAIHNVVGERKGKTKCRNFRHGCYTSRSSFLR